MCLRYLFQMKTGGDGVETIFTQNRSDKLFFLAIASRIYIREAEQTKRYGVSDPEKCPKKQGFWIL